MKNKLFITLVVIGISNRLAAQQWLANMANKSEERSFYDYQAAFAKHYLEHPINLKLDKKKPTFEFAGIDEKNTKAEIEEYKMFKRWEWFMEPRLFPSGKTDNKKILEIKTKVAQQDTQMLQQLVAQEPSNFVAAKSRLRAFFRPVWTLIGPKDAVGGTNMGRVNCIQFDPSNKNTIYIGAPNGGVWKSINMGDSWEPIFDAEPTISVGDIAVDPHNSKIIFVATSDAFGYGVPFWGGTYSVGVMKTTNGGLTWHNTGLNWTVGKMRTIRHLAISPTNPKILLAATSDGLYRTTDAGATWALILPESTYDVKFEQGKGEVVYATTNQVLKSTNAGATFNTLTATCNGTRYNIQIARSNPNVLYALCTTGEVQKSKDAGATWNTVSASGVTLYGYYDNVLAVSPIDENVVFVAGFDIRGTTDGGNTWHPINTAGHVDNHCIAFMPGSKSTIFFGDDGGLFKTTNGGTTWTSKNKGLSVTQFYKVGISNTNPNILIGGAQDNGNMKFKGGVFTNVTNADGMGGFIDRSNDNNLFAAIQNGSLLRSTNGGSSWTDISTSTEGAWVTPLCQHPVTPATIYTATDKVYKSTDQGTTWVAISNSLLGSSKFTIVTVGTNPDFIYAGDGHTLFMTSDGGAHWSNITAGLPVTSNFITGLAAKGTDNKTIYATFSGYNAGQKVYKSTDGGLTWENISGSLPNLPVDCIVYEEKSNNALYIGTDAGVYYRNDKHHDWIPYKFGLPNVIVNDLKIHYGTKTLIAATYGRGIWKAPLRKL